VAVAGDGGELGDGILADIAGGENAMAGLA